MSDRFYFFKGRVALYAILKAIGIKSGDEIILPGFTCIVVSNAITYLGAKPIYVDINPETYNIDPHKIEKKITQKTKALIVQHTFGIPAEMYRIIEIARQYNLYVIEDSCHAIGSKYRAKEVGIFGDAAFFSSQWSKPVTTGLGGWAVVNNEKLRKNMDKVYQEFAKPSYKEITLLRLQYLAYSKIFKPSRFWYMLGVYRELSKLGLVIGSSSKNEDDGCVMPKGYKRKMSQWQKQILEEKLTEITKAICHRKWITSKYESALEEKGMRTVHLSEEYEPVYLRYPLLVKNKRRILSEAKKRRIELGDWFISPIHDKLDEWEKANYQKGMCPIAEKICEDIINLPTHRGISVEEAERIVEFISEFKK